MMMMMMMALVLVMMMVILSSKVAYINIRSTEADEISYANKKKIELQDPHELKNKPG